MPPAAFVAIGPFEMWNADRSFKSNWENTATPEPPNTDMAPNHVRNWALSRHIWGIAGSRHDNRVNLQ